MAKGIYKRGRIWWITFIGPEGKQKFESSRSISKADAEYILSCRRKDIAEGKDPIIRRIPDYTFSELAEKYLAFTINQRSIRSKRSFVRLLLAEFGDLLLKRFNTMIIEHYQSRRISEGKKPATVNRAMATLKHMFTKALDWEMITEEVFKKIKRVKLMPENNRRLRYLSREECQALINVCDPNLKPIVITALNTGMRKGEILSLKWDEIDLKHGFILLDITKNGERREIPINNTLRGVLQGLSRRLDIPYVFYNPATGKPLGDVNRRFTAALRRAKIMDFRFHDLRHTVASHSVMAGVDITTVKELLGHKTLTMTLRYSHLAPSHMVKAVDILDSTLNERSAMQGIYNQEVAVG